MPFPGKRALREEVATREADLMRFGFAPLYLRFADVAEAARRLADILRHRRWDRPEHHARAKVT